MTMMHEMSFVPCLRSAVLFSYSFFFLLPQGCVKWWRFSFFVAPFPLSKDVSNLQIKLICNGFHPLVWISNLCTTVGASASFRPLHFVPWWKWSGSRFVTRTLFVLLKNRSDKIRQHEIKENFHGKRKGLCMLFLWNISVALAVAYPVFNEWTIDI